MLACKCEWTLTESQALTFRISAVQFQSSPGARVVPGRNASVCSPVYESASS